MRDSVAVVGANEKELQMYASLMVRYVLPKFTGMKLTALAK